MSGDAPAERYLRQILLNEVGAEGQARLGRAALQLVGANAAARDVAQDYLERAGVGAVTQAEAMSSREPSGVATVPELDAPAHLAPAADLLAGAFAAVEGLKQVLGVGQPAALSASILLFGEE